MKSITKLAVVGLLAIAAIAAHAQGFGGGGQGRRGGFGRMGGNSNFTLLAREDVQEDLALTSDQKSAYKDAQDNQQEKMKAQFEEMRNSGTRPDPTTMRETFAKMMKEADAEVAKILKPDQLKRLREISIQLDGNKAALKEDVQKDLAITDAQKAQLKKLQDSAQEANNSVMEKARNREIQWTEVQDIMKKNDKALNDEIAKVLTATQKTKLTDLGGKKFVEKEEEKG